MPRRERLFVAAGVLGLLGLWEAMVRLGRLDATLAPAPTTILEALVRLGRLQIVREIYLPAMAPSLLESIRLGMVFNITAVLLCEIYGARDGIGYRIAAWGENLQMPQLYAALTIVAVAAVAVNEGLRLLEARLCSWRQRT